MSLPRYSTVAMLSLATEVEELKIEALTPCFFSLYTWSSIRVTNGDTTRIALFLPSCAPLEMAGFGSTGSCHSQWAMGRQTNTSCSSYTPFTAASCSSFRHTPESPKRDREKETATRKVSSLPQLQLTRLTPPYIHDVVHTTDIQKIYGRIQNSMKME